MKPPETIYLQTDYDGEPMEDEWTWCVDEINETDTKYIRADRVEVLDEKYWKHTPDCSYGRCDCGVIERAEERIEALTELAEAHVRELELQYDQSDDAAHYYAWQQAKKVMT